ncbi:MAG: hypothetical protein GEV09_20715 [Pseudonocardiaceae bacterium]|nr:hypothetical protein [Pseudonocardiaceae bacterium]
MEYALLWAVFGLLCLAVPAIAYLGWLISSPWVEIGFTTENEPIVSKFNRHRHTVAEICVWQSTRDLDREYEREFGPV